MTRLVDSSNNGRLDSDDSNDTIKISTSYASPIVVAHAIKGGFNQTFYIFTH
jgi:hypothetical protein